MDLKHKVSKLISILLILVGFFHLAYSTYLLVFFYPNMSLPQGKLGLSIQRSLIEKALVMYLNLVVDGIYGLVLLTKPKEEIKVLHILLGAVVLAVSTFFMIQTPLTAIPILGFLNQ